MSEDLVRAARSMAILAHGDQKYGDHPYIHHLDAVVEILKDFPAEVRIVGYLHDVLEDTECGASLILNIFGQTVFDCVMLVTDEQGRNRRERKEKTNAKLAEVPPECRAALVVKAADRLANLRECVKTGDSRLEMYRREHPAFKQAAYAAECDWMWQEMDEILSS